MKYGEGKGGKITHHMPFSTHTHTHTHTHITQVQHTHTYYTSAHTSFTVPSPPAAMTAAVSCMLMYLIRAEMCPS